MKMKNDNDDEENDNDGESLLHDDNDVSLSM